MQSKVFKSNNYHKSNYIVIGQHVEFGVGILSFHISEWHAKYNSMIFNLDSNSGSNTIVIPKKELNNLIMDIKLIHDYQF